MKIYVIDNSEQIKPELLTSYPDVSFFADEIQAINALEQHKPNLILLHYHMRGKDTAKYIELLLTISPLTDIILIGDNLTDEQVVNCLLAGAKGYQNSGDLAIYIDKIIRVVAADEAWISRRLTARLLEAMRKESNLANNDFYFSGQFIEATTEQLHH